MPGLKELTNIWENVREVDLRPIREEASQEVKILLAGRQGSGRRTLAENMRRDPARPGVHTTTPIAILDLEVDEQAVKSADLIVIMVSASGEESERHRLLSQEWTRAGKKVIVFYNMSDRGAGAENAGSSFAWEASKMLLGPAGDPEFLLAEFVPAVMEILPEQNLSLARHFPLFRVPVAKHLINETSFSNAVYSLSTGLAEIVPVLDIPLNISDMIVLTKAQAFLVYRLGLAFGFSTEWQDYLSEFGSVVGGGFLWRQLARQLVGLIPVWGIVPKVAVAYAGTYVVGNVILRWYLTGRKVSPAQIRAMYREAFDQGKKVAGELVDKVPRPRLRRRRDRQLPAAIEPAGQVCPNCGKTSAPDAQYCQYCGEPLTGQATEAASGK